MAKYLPLEIVVAALVGCLIGSQAAADDKNADRDNSDQTRAGPVSDEQFVQRASASDLAEISMGKMALEQGTSPQVKAFAKRLVADHMTSSKMLLSIADRLGLMPAKTMGKQHRMVMDKMAQLTGPAFDQRFAQQMVEDHRKAIELYSAQSKNGKDENLRMFAAKALPVLKEHLKMAQDLAGGEAPRGRER